MTDPAEGIGGSDDGDEPRAPDRSGRAAVIALFVACLIPEAVLFGADWGLWGNPRWRAALLQDAAFWPGLLRNWQPNYPLQPLAMFLTYGFLHAGLVHFIVNMLTLVSLGPTVADRVGPARFGAIWIAATVGGALGFALIAHTYSPMVGASGALFGLAGALLAWDYTDRRARRLSLTPVLRALLLLVALNLVLWWAINGLLAWQTHLGGFVAGWAMAVLLDRPRRYGAGSGRRR